MVGEPVTGSTTAIGRTVVYARVSSAEQKPDLDRQVARVTVWATGQSLAVDRVVTEVGSALNGQCKKFFALLRDPAVTKIVVEHRDRFARFGAEYIEAALSAQGRRLPGGRSRDHRGRCGEDDPGVPVRTRPDPEPGTRQVRARRCGPCGP